MRGEKTEQDKKIDYFYTRCSNCGIKLHYATYRCWKCGEKPVNNLWHSTNPENAKYCANYCSVEKCINCWNVQNGGKHCEPIMCFGTGRGKCDLCKRMEGLRYDCCQEYQRLGVPITKEEIRKNMKPEAPVENEIPF